MADASSTSAAVRFLDRELVLACLREAVRHAQARHPEISRVLLVGSFARGNWTADSDADLVVIVRREFGNRSERARYQIFTPAIPTDSLVYSESEFARLTAAPGGMLADALTSAIELG
jgi:hypothetical protein